MWSHLEQSYWPVTYRRLVNKTIGSAEIADGDIINCTGPFARTLEVVQQVGRKDWWTPFEVKADRDMISTEVVAKFGHKK